MAHIPPCHTERGLGCFQLLNSLDNKGLIKQFQKIVSSHHRIPVCVSFEMVNFSFSINYIYFYPVFKKK